MAVATMKVPTIFTAQDKFSSVINTMTKNTRTFSAGISRMNNRINDEMTSMTRVAKYAAIAAGTTLFYKAGEDIIAYEKAIASLGAVTGTVVGSMNKDIESLGKETNRSVIDVAGSFENIGSKMSEYLKNPTALREIAKQSILMADASRMSVEDSTDNLTSLLNQFKLSYKDANRVVNKLSAGEDIGASTISESADVVRQFAASARMAGADLEETIALVQTTTKTLGKHGVGRGFRNLMVDLNTGKGMDKNKLKALKMVGADINKIINPSTKFIDKLKEIKKLLGNKQAMGMFFKKTGFETGATFLGSFDMFEKYLKFIEEKNTAQIKADKNNASFAKGWQNLKNSFTNFIVTNQNSNTALSVTKGLMEWMVSNMGNIVNLVASIGVAFLGWKAIVLVVSLVSGVVEAFSLALSFHQIVMAGAALANVSYATSLGAVALALWAAYWPFLAVAAVLGLLVYAFWDAGKATDNMVSNQMLSLNKGNQALINSTGVMDSELQKQLNLQNGFNKKMRTNYDTPWWEGNAITENVHKTVSPFIDKEIAKANRSPLFEKRVTPADYKKIMPVVATQKSFINTSSISTNNGKPENLAGKSSGLTNEILKQMSPQQVEVWLKGDTGNVSEVKGANVVGGIPARTTSTKKPFNPNEY